MKHLITISWLVSIIIAFYLGSQFAELNGTNQDNSSESLVLSSTNNTAAKTVANVTAAPQAATQQNQITNTKISNDNENINTTGVNLDKTLAELTNLLANSSNFAAIGKAYNLITALSLEQILSSLDTLTNAKNAKENVALISLLLSQYATHSPTDALDYVENNLVEPQLKTPALIGVLSIWAEQQPGAAFNWLVNNSDNETGNYRYDSRSFATMIVFKELAKNNLPTAIENLSYFQENLRRLEMATTGITQSLETSEEFIQLLNNEFLAKFASVNGQILGTWVNKSPQDAIAWTNNLDDREKRAASQELIMGSWMWREPEKAGNWYLAQASYDNKQDHADKIVTRWNTAPADALSWLSQQTGIDVQQSTAKLLRNTIYTDPNFVENKLDSLTNHQDRLEISVQLYHSLANQISKQRAEQFLQNSPIKDDIVKRLGKTP